MSSTNVHLKWLNRWKDAVVFGLICDYAVKDCIFDSLFNVFLVHVDLRLSKRRLDARSVKFYFVSLLNRSIQDFSNHGASEEPKNPLPDWILRCFCVFEPPWSKRSWIDPFRKETQRLFSDSFGFKNPILGFLKETHPIYFFVRIRKQMIRSGSQ